MCATSRMTTSQPTEPRSERKRRAILEAATETFLRKGYLGTTMDEIAASAAVSKQTVYKHFADKESLFTEIVTGAVDAVSDPHHEDVLGLADTGGVEADLRALAERQLERVMQPRLLALRRLVIGEAGRFPELGRAYYERGPGARSRHWRARSSGSPRVARSSSRTRTSRPPTSTGS